MSADDAGLSGPQCRAARALCELSRDDLAALSGIAHADIRAFETRLTEPDIGKVARLRHTLEGAGAVFLDDDLHGGRGVRLKFSAAESASIDRLENEGGPAAEDDVGP